MRNNYLNDKALIKSVEAEFRSTRHSAEQKKVMRQQTRPFIVEIKQRRGGLKRNSSIWGKLNLSKIAAEFFPESEDLDTQHRKWDISDVPLIDVEDRKQKGASYG